MRHGDHAAQAVAARREGDRLAVVAARGGDDAAHRGLAAHQCIHVDQAAAQLERADRCVVLVLDPDLGSERGAEQRPGVLRRRRQHTVHEPCGGVDRGTGGQGRELEVHGVAL